MIPLPRILDNNGNETGRLHPLSLSVNENIVPLSYASMEVANREIVPGRTWVEIFNTNGSLGIYRTRAPQENYGVESSMLQLEHGCVEIGDWLVTDAIKGEYSVREAFEIINSFYRGSYWQLGAFVADEKVVLNLDYENVLEALLGALEQAPQYMMVFDFGTKPWTFSIERKSETVTAEGRLSRNITSASVVRDDKDLCTRVYVNGLPKPAGRERDENAVGYMDSENTSVYGIVEKKEDGGIDLTVEEATRFAQTYLSLHDHPRFTIDIDGVDLSAITNVPLDSFRLGKLFRLVVPKYNVVVQDYITAVSWPNIIKNPKQCNVTVGTDQDPTISFLSKQKTATKSGQKRIKQLELTSSYMRAALVGAIEGIFAFVENSLSETRDLIAETASALTGSIEGLATFVDESFAGVNSDLRTMGSNMNALGSSVSALRADVNALQEGVYNLRITQSGDSYTLQKRNIKSETWVDVGTFSRATSLSGAWSGAVYTVTASPQGNTNSVTIVQRISGSSSGVTASAQFGVMDGQTFVQHGSDTNGYLVLNGTGSTAKVDLNSRNDGTGVVYARKSVSIVWNNGYDDARGKIEYPEEAAANTEVTSFTLKVPNAARDGQDTKTFSLAKGSPGSSGYASVSLAGTGVVGRIDISNWWKDGWDDARAQIDYPDELKGSSEVTTFYLDVPNAARTGHDTKTFTVTKGTPGTTGFAAVSLAGVGVVGRISIGNWYCKGSSDVTLTNPSYNSVSTVGSSRTVTVSTSGRVNSSGAAANLSKSVSLYLSPAGWSGSSQIVYLRTDNASTGTVIAKTSISAPTVSMNPSANQTLNPGGSVTVYAVQNSQSVASVKVSAKSAWLYYATQAGSQHQGTLESNRYVCIGYSDGTNTILKDDVTWLTPSSGGTHNIDIPTVQIYTSGTSRGTPLNVLRNRYEQARSDAEFVMFRVDCGGTSKWYYMEP